MPTRAVYSPAGGLWYLEGFPDGSRRLHRVPVLRLPFKIGRRSDQDLTLASNLVSSRHAEIRPHGRGLEIVDLESTNGTLLNGQPVTAPHRLEEGDIVQFATFEFRVGVLEPGRTEALLGATTEIGTALPELLVARTLRFRELLEGERVEAWFQPIVSLADRTAIGHEILGRSALDSLPLSSFELFELAAVVGAEARLSRLFRRLGAEACRALPNDLLYFVNTHPAEMRERGLFDSLEALRAEHPDLRLVLEIHEAAITDPADMSQLRAGLRSLRIGLAYDDFGSGQARLAELSAAPPDYLKFDRSMVAGIDQPPANRQRVLAALVAMATDLGIAAVAEGLEQDEEAAVCAELGFTLGQGFLFGVPAPAATLAEPQS